MSEEKKFLLSKKDILGNVALWAIRQSPYHRPDNLELVIDQLNVSLPDPKDYFFKMTYREIFDFLKKHLWEISEFMAWNNRKNGNQSQYGFIDRYSQTHPDNDFIDLDALVKNVAGSIIGEEFQTPISNIINENAVKEANP